MPIILDGTAGISSPAINAGNIVGQVCFFGMTTAPDGFLKANGAAVSRTTFAALFAAIGTTYGAGDGSTTFALPDMRGEFPRGFDDGRGVDSGRAFGSAQLDQMQLITGQTGRPEGSSGNTFGLFESNFSGALSGGGSSVRAANAESTGVSRLQRVKFDSGNSPNARASATTNGETRARNIALLACIKF